MTNAEIADWEDERVQLVYRLLCDGNEPPNPEEHWEGWTARRIVAALREPDDATVERASRALAKLEVPQAEWAEDFTDAERQDYRRCAAEILRAARESWPVGTVERLRALLVAIDHHLDHDDLQGSTDLHDEIKEALRA